VQKAEKTCGDTGARQRTSLDGLAAIGWEVAGQVQGGHCRADTDTRARPRLTDKSVLR